MSEERSLSDRFESFDEEFLKFERIEKPLHPRPDLCGFLMLHAIDPDGTGDIVGGAEHDEIYLSFDCDKLSLVTDDFIRDLHRCGVRYDSEYDSLCMFV